MITSNIVLRDATTAATITTDAFRLQRMVRSAIQVVWTGTINGTLTLQYCNDVGDGSTAEPPGGLDNWTTVTGSSQATGGAAGSHVWDVETGARWVRVVYTHTSGTGNMKITANAKGE